MLNNAINGSFRAAPPVFIYSLWPAISNVWGAIFKNELFYQYPFSAMHSFHPYWFMYNSRKFYALLYSNARAKTGFTR